VVGVVELAAIVVEVEVEITVVMEEGVVRGGSLVIAPSEEKSTVVLVPPFGTIFTPTVWRPPRGRTHSYKTRKRSEERGSKEVGSNLKKKFSA
jgi:hypothetical protein